MAAVSLNPGISMQPVSSNTAEARMGGISFITQLVGFSSLSRREILHVYCVCTRLTSQCFS